MLPCWACDKPDEEDILVNGLCSVCTGKFDEIEAPVRPEELERMKALHRLIASAVFTGIEAADRASMERDTAKEDGS